MRYRAHPGIVLRKLGGCWFLAADREGHKDCPRVRELNEYAAFYWTLLAQGMDTEEIKEKGGVRFGITPKEAGEGLEPFAEQLCELHYLVPLIED